MHGFPIPVPAFHNRVARNVPPLIEVRDLNVWYEAKHALCDVNLDIYPNEILAFIGPSGCGKSTALLCLNRMHDGRRDVRVEGSVLLQGQDIYAPEVDPPVIRRRMGWVAQKPNPFPRSIYENVAYAPRLHGLVSDKAELEAHVEDCLRRASLWDEVKDHMHDTAGTALSGGQQQRLCIARALSTKPDVLLMDEPTGSIDPIATARVEELMVSLKEDHAIVVITHSLMEAARVADRVAYFHMGRLLEIGATDAIMTAPSTIEAKRFIGGLTG